MNADNGRAPYSGDSGNSPMMLAFVKGTILIEIGVFLGGPAIQSDDGTLLGVVAVALLNGDPPNVIAHASTNVRFYFDWISEITGLDLPKC